MEEKKLSVEVMKREVSTMNYRTDNNGADTGTKLDL